jgi:Leucine Rich repeat
MWVEPRCLSSHWKGKSNEIRWALCQVCPACLCHSLLVQGIINRHAKDKRSQGTTPLSLHLCGNPDLGDSGAAAIAAAIRTVVGDGIQNVVLDTLDLSACDIGDVGAEAIALALESCPGMCIRHLDLSNNKLSDVGAAAIGHALLSSGAAGPAIETLDLSGNTEIKDKSAVVLAEAVEKGLVSSIRLRSCHILADGAAAFGKALAGLSRRGATTSSKLEIDLSGNPLGILRGKTKKGGKYSASAIKSKATATTAAYLSMIRKGIAGGLKEYGVELGGNSGESDDDEENRNGITGEFTSDGGIDPGKARCGIKAFANAVLDSDASERTKGQSASSSQPPLRCELGLRRCFLDHGAADSLAAVLCHSKDELGINLSIDVGLNPVLEEEMTAAIQGDENHEDGLKEMSERYMDALEVLRESRERAMVAAKTAAARIQAEKDRESQWDAPQTFSDDPWEQDGWAEAEQQDEWDSDADYEQDNEEEDYD